MIALVEGALLEKNVSSVVIAAGGIGYEIAVPLSTFEKLPDEGETARLLTYLHVREDALQLFGFHSRQEREAFERLIAVTGVGPRLALSILSSLSVERLIAAVEGAQASWFGKIPGVGKKTAERLIFELKGKLTDIAPAAALGKAAAPAGREAEEAAAALVSLGYSRPQAETAIARVLADSPGQRIETADLIRKSLGRM